MTAHSEKTKMKALEVFDQEGVWAAVEQTGVHHTTIYRWNAERVRSLVKTPEDVALEEQVVMTMRSHLRRRMLEVAMTQVDRVDVATNGREAQAFATAAGILTDKFRLEMGETTSVVENRGDPKRASATAEERLDQLAEQRAKRAS